MKGIIILEGPDGAGKTTLCDELTRQATDMGIDVEYVHLSWSKYIDPYMEHVNLGAIANAIETAMASNTLVLIDRCSISTYIYANVFRDSSTQASNMFHNTLCMVSESDVPFAFLGVLPKFSVWKDNYDQMVASREEMYGDDPRMIQIYEEYEKLFKGKATATTDLFINGIGTGIVRELDEKFPSCCSGIFDFTKDNKGDFVEGVLTQMENQQ